jgi:flagellar biosynthesis anti-sigma factor FlgM
MRIGAGYSSSSSSETTAADKSKEALKGQSAAKSSAGAPTSEGAVKVTLSAKARELDQAHAPDASEKVQRLRAAVESGQLPIDPQKIAAAIVGE